MHVLFHQPSHISVRNNHKRKLRQRHPSRCIIPRKRDETNSCLHATHSFLLWIDRCLCCLGARTWIFKYHLNRLQAQKGIPWYIRAASAALDTPWAAALTFRGLQEWCEHYDRGGGIRKLNLLGSWHSGHGYDLCLVWTLINKTSGLSVRGNTRAASNVDTKSFIICNITVFWYDTV
jgi:hypothetical protein